MYRSNPNGSEDLGWVNPFTIILTILALLILKVIIS